MLKLDASSSFRIYDDELPTAAPDAPIWTAKSARALVQRAFDAGVESPGFNIRTGRPLWGCDPDDEQAVAAFQELRDGVAKSKLVAQALSDKLGSIWRHDPLLKAKPRRLKLI